jgi:NADP-dependent aldehyde dehydrogenase
VGAALAEQVAGHVAGRQSGSFTLGAGQLCTKPGLVLVPTGVAGDGVVDAMAAALGETGPQVLLNAGIAEAYERVSTRLAQAPGVSTVARGAAQDGPGFAVAPLLLTAPASRMPQEVSEECFGPVNVVVRYDGEGELFHALGELPPSLTAAVLRGAGETAVPRAISERLRPLAGRSCCPPNSPTPTAEWLLVGGTVGAAGAAVAAGRAENNAVRAAIRRVVADVQPESGR